MKVFLFLSALCFVKTNAITQVDSSLNRRLEHTVFLNQYVYSFSSNGGTELSYGLKIRIKKRMFLSARTGFLFQAPYFYNLEKDKKITNGSTSYIPFFLGAGYEFGKRKEFSTQIEFGIPVFWLSEYSKLSDIGLFSDFWIDESTLINRPGLKRKNILLIPQIEFNYHLKSGIGFQLGLSSFLTQYVIGGASFSGLIISEPQLNFTIGGKLGLSYRF